MVAPPYGKNGPVRSLRQAGRGTRNLNPSRPHKFYSLCRFVIRSLGEDSPTLLLSLHEPGQQRVQHQERFPVCGHEKGIEWAAGMIAKNCHRVRRRRHRHRIVI